MSDINELLEQAAPAAGGRAPVDAIIRRGRRRQLATRAMIGAPLAVATVALGAFLLADGPTGVVIDPPPMAETPDPAPAPSPSGPEPSAPPSGDGQPTAAPEAVGWVQPAGLDADLLVVATGGDPTRVVRLGRDGSLEDVAVEAGVPNSAGLVPDGAGGFVWQPDWESAEAAPVLHLHAGGEITALLPGIDPAEITLVGWDHGLGRPLVTHRRGAGFDDTTADLLTVPLEGGDGEVLRTGVGAWEVGVSHAAVLETALYAQYVEAMHNLVLHPRDGEPRVVYEAGELTGEYLGGVGILDRRGVGVALVGTMPGLPGDPRARLLLVDLESGGIVEEIDVPLAVGDGDVRPGTVARDVSIVGSSVLVNRTADGSWMAPIVYDTEAGSWSGLEHRAGGDVVGRAALAPPVRR